MYRAVLRDSRLARPFVASLVARLPIGAMGLVLLLRTEDITGSYAAGGLVAGVNALAMALAAPLLGRLVDRRGQTLVVAGSGLVSLAAWCAFAALPNSSGLEPALLIGAVAGAAYPPVGPALRVLWTEGLDATRRHTAFNLEAVAVEMVYISGPLLILAAVGSWSMRAAAVACGLFGGIGALLFAASRASREWRPARADGGRHGALRSPGVRVLLATITLFGVAVIGIEVAIPAFVEDHDAAWATGPVLAVWGAGSLVGGLVAGRRPAPADPARHTVRLLFLLAAATAPVALAPGVPGLFAGMFLAGLAIAPAMASAFALLGQVAPRAAVTEAYMWVGTGMGAGSAAGAALGGVLAEEIGPRAALLLGAVALTAAAGVARAGRGHLSAPAAPPAAAAVPEPVAA